MYFIDTLTILGIAIAAYVAIMILVIPSSFSPGSGTLPDETRIRLLVLSGCALLITTLSIGLLSVVNTKRLSKAQEKGYTLYFNGSPVTAEEVTPPQLALAYIKADEYLMTIEAVPMVKKTGSA